MRSVNKYFVYLFFEFFYQNIFVFNFEYYNPSSILIVYNPVFENLLVCKNVRRPWAKKAIIHIATLCHVPRNKCTKSVASGASKPSRRDVCMQQRVYYIRVWRLYCVRVWNCRVFICDGTEFDFLVLSFVLYSKGSFCVTHYLYIAYRWMKAREYLRVLLVWLISSKERRPPQVGCICRTNSYIYIILYSMAWVKHCNLWFVAICVLL